MRRSRICPGSSTPTTSSSPRFWCRPAGWPTASGADECSSSASGPSSPRRPHAVWRHRSRSWWAARVVQAAGAAILVPTSLGLLLPEFPLEQRATATALWGATGAVAAAAGPSLGGVLVEATSWRWVFFVNLAIGLPALIPARRLLRERREEHPGPLPDLVGVILLVIAVGLLLAWHCQGPGLGLGQRPRDRLARRLRSCARGVRRALGAPSGAGGGTRPAARAVVRRCQRRRVPVRTGLLRPAARQHPLPHRRLGLVGAQGRHRRHSRPADGRGRRCARRAPGRSLRPARRRAARRAPLRRGLPALRHHDHRDAALRIRVPALDDPHRRGRRPQLRGLGQRGGRRASAVALCDREARSPRPRARSARSSASRSSSPSSAVAAPRTRWPPSTPPGS